MDFPLKSVFLALPLEQGAKWQFQALQEELKPYEDILRFQNPQTPHITLMYWSEVSELEMDGIRAQVTKISAKHQPFNVEVTQANTFGSRGEDKVLFLEVAFSDALARLKKSCPWSDGRPFHPHVTLARMRNPQKFAVQKKKIMKLLANCPFSINVDHLRLYAEVDGIKQTPLADFALTGL